MNGDEIPLRELDALSSIKRIDQILNHHNNLLAAFNNDGVELTQFLLFLMINNLVTRTERYLLLTVFMKLQETHGLNSYMKLIWEIERDAKEGVLLLQDLFTNKSYPKVRLEVKGLQSERAGSLCHEIKRTVC